VSRTPSTQRRDLEVLRRPGGDAGEPGPSGSPATQTNPTQQVVTTLHQLIDTLTELSKAPSPAAAPTPAQSLPLLLDAVEAGKLLSVSRSKVLAMAGSGDIPSLRLGGSVRIPRDRLIEWIEERTKEPEWLRGRRLPAWARADRSVER
jgi:excisionase family DNA binding protein